MIDLKENAPLLIAGVAIAVGFVVYSGGSRSPQTTQYAATGGTNNSNERTAAIAANSSLASKFSDNIFGGFGKLADFATAQATNETTYRISRDNTALASHEADLALALGIQQAQESTRLGIATAQENAKLGIVQAGVLKDISNNDVTKTRIGSKPSLGSFLENIAGSAATYFGRGA